MTGEGVTRPEPKTPKRARHDQQARQEGDCPSSGAAGEHHAYIATQNIKKHAYIARKVGGESMLQAAQKRGWHWVGQMIDGKTGHLRPPGEAGGGMRRWKG